MLKQILIPVAAFAVTAVGASAFTGPEWLANSNLDLSDSQVSALEEAREIRTSAQEEAKAVLEKAGLDQTKMREIHEAMRESRQEKHEAVESAFENNDYEAFKVAVADTPMAEKITSEADFEKLAEAHELRESGDKDGAKAIMEDLGITGPKGGMMGEGRGMHEGFGGPDRDE
jgi:hypothetical protein